uniref:Peptidase M1 leukotriene A4 hydrolase/aminopeptidase C-terminal domain-containing protein n=1 Tax=Plectus sambesii TaxID=2011161 RepID=A0A914UIT3_9BILA
MVTARDPASCANFTEATIKHVDLKWFVDFDKKTLNGSATLNILIVKDTNHVNLDTRDLTIRSLLVDNEIAKFTEEVQEMASFGTKLTVHVGDRKAGEKFKIHIEFETSTTASALQWFAKEQTADKVEQMVFSYCQEINARSILPCMDTPSVKQTYHAEVTVPNSVVALMSAVSTGTPQPSPDHPGFLTYSFKQKVPIPSYLLAFVAGRLDKRDISNRCAVWAEYSVVDKAAFEFAENEEVLKIADDLMGPYVWGRYDVLILPPSFPFGGMENPCLTFMTSAVLAGDRSLSSSIVAHEISHSWMGNLVTNATWEHMWINEGNATFIERKIEGRRFNEQYRHLLALSGWTESLEPAILKIFNPTHPSTKLVQDQTGIDPKDAFSFVPYEKGHTFLFYLEEKLGGAAVFDPFLRAYIQHFIYQTIDTEQWKEFFFEYFKDKQDVLNTIDFDSWLNKPGMPPVKPNYDNSLAAKCIELRNAWLNANETDVDKLDGKAFEGFTPMQKIEFFNLLSKTPEPLPHYKLERVESVYKIAENNNCEIIVHWIQLCIRARWPKIIDRAIEFVSTIGRLKLCRPVYRDLLAWDATADLVKETYMKNKKFMHPITAEMAAKDLGLFHA